MSEEKDIIDNLSKCPRETHSNWLPILEKHIYEIRDVYKKIYLEDKTDFKDLAPSIDEIWRAFIIDPHDIKVIIIGQDPYPKEGDANGLSFSCNQKETPASLKKIFSCLNRHGYKTDSNDLFTWVLQGVFLINMSLTTKIGCKRKHSQYWISVVSNIISSLTLMNKAKKMSIMLWGNDAQSVEPYIKGKHNILKWTHPSPMADNKLETSKQFVNCTNFDNLLEIDWSTGKQIIIYTDGGCELKHKAAYAVYCPDILKISGLVENYEYELIENRNRKHIVVTDKDKDITSQRAEFLALSYALWIAYRLKLKNVLIVTDSNNARGIVVEWTKRKEEKYKNLDLVKIMRTLYELVKDNVTIEHVQSHSKTDSIYNGGNEIVDKMATECLKTATTTEMNIEYLNVKFHLDI